MTIFGEGSSREDKLVAIKFLFVSIGLIKFESSPPSASDIPSKLIDSSFCMSSSFTVEVDAGSIFSAFVVFFPNTPIIASRTLFAVCSPKKPPPRTNAPYIILAPGIGNANKGAAIFATTAEPPANPAAPANALSNFSPNAISTKKLVTGPNNLPNIFLRPNLATFFVPTSAPSFAVCLPNLLKKPFFVLLTLPVTLSATSPVTFAPLLIPVTLSGGASKSN